MPVRARESFSTWGLARGCWRSPRRSSGGDQCAPATMSPPRSKRLPPTRRRTASTCSSPASTCASCCRTPRRRRSPTSRPRYCARSPPGSRSAIAPASCSARGSWRPRSRGWRRRSPAPAFSSATAGSRRVGARCGWRRTMAEAAGNHLPIAVFDSGVGGLTVLHECLVSLPSEDFLYLGDSSHFPYGIKSSEELSARVERVTRFLLDRGAKLLVIACNSATSAGAEAARAIADERDVEVVTVIEPEAEIAAAITESGRVGVLATPATVESGSYHRALARQGRILDVTEVAAP